MSKKVKNLLWTDILEICKKFYNKDSYDTCKNCPLKVDTIHCLKGLLDEKVELEKKLIRVDKLVENFLDKNKETEIDF